MSATSVGQPAFLRTEWSQVLDAAQLNADSVYRGA